MAEFRTELKIPKDRIAVLIGTDGEIKNDLEEKTNTDIEVDSKEGDVYIEGNDGLNIFDAKEVVLAIGRGFNPKIAFLLLKGDYVFEIINLKDYASTKAGWERLKGRIIGAEGKARKAIEALTDSNMSVYGKTISVIGHIEEVSLAKQAITSLLQGATHSSVYRWLEKKRKLIKRDIVERKEEW